MNIRHTTVETIGTFFSKTSDDRPPPRFRSAPWTLLVICWLVCAGAAHGAIIVNQPMTGTAAPGWVFGGSQGVPPLPTFSAYLTAPSLDTAGNGWLRLTDAATDEAGYAYYDTPFDLTQGSIIQYDYATWGGTGADGYSVFLFDGSIFGASFNVGASGGSLGFGQKTIAGGAAADVPGLSGGYIGIGIDEYGNFSNPSEGRYLGPGARASAVAIRGPRNPLDPLGASYPYIAGTAANVGTLWFNQGTRPVQTGAQYRKVVIKLTPVTAPNYLSVDVFLQFGMNQPLTQVISGAYIGRQPPASVKIGYAASTGGSTNIHEIRNLIIYSPNSDLDLSVTNFASLPSITVGNAITYTVTAFNYGPSNTSVTGATITDNVPPEITGVTWTCTGSGGGACGAASGNGNTISTTANLPFNGSVTYTITGTLTAIPAGGQLINTATITPPGGVTDYNPNNNNATSTIPVVGAGAGVTVSGTVFSDSGSGGGTAHNGVKDGTEGSSNINNIYAKLFRAGDATALQVVAVTQASGAYSFSNVPTNGTYTIILSSDNTANFTPSFPSTNWVYTLPLNYTLTGVAVGSSNVTNQNFGVYNGTRFSGRVFRDDGVGGGTANDGIQNGTEPGRAGVVLAISNNANGTAIDTTTTDANGDYALFINWGNAFTSGTARITETTLPAGYLMVNYSSPNTSGNGVNTGNSYVTFTFNRGTDATGINFGDVPDNSFVVTPQAQTVPPGSTVYYAHTFTPGSAGSANFAVNSRTQGGWPAVVLYRDVACSGTYNAADPILSNPIAATVGTPICIIVGESVPAGATIGTTDVITVRGTFTFTGSVRPAASTYDVVDTTTVGLPPSLTVIKTASPASVKSGQVITYTIQVTNTGGGTAKNVLLTDSLGPYIYWGVNSYGAGAPFQFVDGSPASGLTLGTPIYSLNNGATWSYTPASGAGGAPAGYDVNVTNWQIPMTGTMNANGANFTLRFQVLAK